MENPATWGRAEHIVHYMVHEILDRRERDRANGDFRAELSLARQVTDALRAEGLLVPETDCAGVVAMLLESDALTSNRSDDGTPDWYIVEPENLEYLVDTVLKLATLESNK